MGLELLWQKQNVISVGHVIVGLVQVSLLTIAIVRVKCQLDF